MGEPKILLKEARKAIDSGEFETAVEKCKAVLKTDGKNYMALIFLGVALRDDEKAEDAFKKAIALNDNNVLAYQGLAKFYDNKGTKEYLKSLIKLYYRMITLSGVKEVEIYESINNVALRIDDYNECGNIINDFLSKESDGERQNQLIILLSKILTYTNGTMDKDTLSLYQKVLNLSDEKLDDVFFLKYFKCLLEVEGYNFMFQKFWEVPWEILILREWICEIFARAFVLKLYVDFDYNKTKSLVSGVIKEMPNSEYGKIAATVLKLINNDKFNAYIDVCDILKTNCKNKLVCILQAICCIDLSRYIEAESIAGALAEDADNDVAIRSKRILLIAKSSQKASEKCLEGIKIAENLNPIYMEEMERVGLFNAYIQLELFEKAESCLKNLTDSPVYYAKLLKKTGKTDEAIEVLTTNIGNLLCKTQLGMYCLETKEYKSAFMHLLESAKNYPFNFEIFLYLGDYYTLSGKSHEKAKRCYLKAFELNPECYKAGKNLSNTYLELKEWNANATFLLSLTNSVIQVSENQSNWPWLHLGLHYIALEQWDTAIVHLRTYIRLNSSDVDAWETLADAYYHRGSYTSAMKCYKKAIEIDPQKKYCIVQIGTIQCLLGFFRDALSTYATITDDSFLPAVKGLAEVKVCIANELLSQNLYGLCRDQAQEAINLISPSVLTQHKLSCLWKILTDSIMIISKLPPKYNWLCFEGDYLFNNDSGLSRYEGKEILNLAILCVSKTINLIAGSNAHLYHELAAIYLALYEHTDEFQYAKKSYLAIIQCLETQKERWQHWNLLGIICISKAVNKRSLAQHAFIKALELDPINAMLWSNLGVFYTVVGNNVLGNQVFMKAQEANPTFIQSWIGQALIAESVGHHEAMDLFRHASQLGFHKESSLGYACWVANSMIELRNESSSSLTYSIENMHALPAACDLMAWYNQFETKNPCSWNIYGLLLEKMGCFRNSVEAFRNALDYVENDNKDTVILNLARGYANLKEYRNAIDVIISTEDIKSMFVYPLAFYFSECGEYENSYSTYNKMLELTDNEHEKCDILIAMANIAFKVDDMETAETLLSQCIFLEEGKLYLDGVIALCAFYLLRSDVDSAEVALREVMKLDESAVSQRLPYFITLKSYCVLLREGPLAAVRSICKYIHTHPNAENLWKTAANSITKDVLTSKMCVRKCLSFNNVVENMEYLKLACLTELSTGNYKKSKIYAQKAIRSRPDNADNWALLLASSLPNTSESSEAPFNEDSLKSLLKYVLENFKVDQQLAAWLTNILNMQLENH
ncbi:tetratricopeptide repeat protein 37-like [Arctopsyche grandis]|uniref:tetratricopeptide repeat protein 37-like n=1 Tax=Arctopsyche grandis TaxID=121162 RepID=UPI00406D9C00